MDLRFGCSLKQAGNRKENTTYTTLSERDGQNVSGPADPLQINCALYAGQGQFPTDQRTGQ